MSRHPSGSPSASRQALSPTRHSPSCRGGSCAPWSACVKFIGQTRPRQGLDPNAVYEHGSPSRRAPPCASSRSVGQTARHRSQMSNRKARPARRSTSSEWRVSGKPCAYLRTAARGEQRCVYLAPPGSPHLGQASVMPFCTLRALPLRWHRPTYAPRHHRPLSRHQNVATPQLRHVLPLLRTPLPTPFRLQARDPARGDATPHAALVEAQASTGVADRERGFVDDVGRRRRGFALRIRKTVLEHGPRGRVGDVAGVVRKGLASLEGGPATRSQQETRACRPHEGTRKYASARTLTPSSTSPTRPMGQSPTDAAIRSWPLKIWTLTRDASQSTTAKARLTGT